MTSPPGNWAGNYTYRAVRLHEPQTVEQLQELVARSEKVKALGTRHSFNDIADSSGDLISLAHLDKILALDTEQRTVTVEGGVRYGQLARWLHARGYALHNLASLPHISVAGACATATHGSGDRHGCLATAVSAMEMITASGEVIVLSRAQHPAELEAAVVSLGGLAIVTKLTLDVSASFDMRQDVYENLPLAALEEHFDDLTTRAYSLSLFTDWSRGMINQVWLKRRVTDDATSTAEPQLFGATLATSQLHPIAGVSAENCTEQLGVSGPWFERLPHFRMDFTPSRGDELQSEYLLPRGHAIAAFHALDRLREHIAPLLFTSEVRTIAADNLWMSPFYQRDCIGIHFTWKPDWPAVQQLLPMIEEALAPSEARPHWAKLFTMSAVRLQSLYPRLSDFRHVLEQYDPLGKFRNDFLDRYIFGEMRGV